MKITVLGLETLKSGKTAISDPRLDKLEEIFKPSKVTPLQIEFVDEAGSITADAIVCAKTKLLDLVINDLEIAETRLSIAESAQEKTVLSQIKDALDKERPLCQLNLSVEQIKLVSSFNFLTLKPVVIIEDETSLPKDEIVASVFKGLGLICFFTANEKELRAWLIKSGTTAWEAAGLIHSDIQRGFIKAEVLGFEDLVKCGGINQAKGAGLVKLQDKDYQVRDGDLIKFRFSV